MFRTVRNYFHCNMYYGPKCPNSNTYKDGVKLDLERLKT